MGKSSEKLWSELLNLISRNMQQSVVVYSLPISRVVGKEQCDGEK